MALSVIIPSRNERYLLATVADLLAKAVGDIEILPVLDGPPFVSFPQDSRIRPILHDGPHGMRPSINEAASRARGDYLMKCDAHCLFDHGFDQVVTSEIEDDWVVVPRRYSLDPVGWRVDHADPPRDYHYLCFPYHDPSKPPILRGLTWKQRAADRAHLTLDDEMTSQGSCWVMSKRHWNRIGPLDTEHYGPFQMEFQEIGCKTWLGGGSVKVQKRTWYAHLYKRDGQGYALSRRQSREGIQYAYDHWFFDRWPNRVRDFSWLIEHFWPVPNWPDNWQARREAGC